VLAELDRREADSESFIRPQRRHADIVVSFIPGESQDPDELDAHMMLGPGLPHPDLSTMVTDEPGRDRHSRSGRRSRPEGSSANFTRTRDHSAMPKVLVVDDEPAVRRALERALRLDSYDVALAADGEEALDALASSPADAVILDVAMPRLDGLEVCRRMRQAGDRTPVLMLTARDAIDDRVLGLDVGADDYLVKPFALRELQARLRALLRRAGDGTDGETLSYADLVLDPVAHEVRRGDRLIELSRTEFLLLELFLQHPRQVLTRSTIFERVWGYDFGPTSNALGVYMGYLRRKTEAAGEPRLLHTVRGVGYVLRD
jgi:two-component system response regulator MprA